MELTMKTSFSATHRTLLSKLAPSTMSLAACAISAVSSTITGGLPGPAATHFLPDFMATPTTASPPVTASILMALWVIMTFEVSSVGSFAAVIRPFGPPAFTIASLSSSMAF